MLATPLCAQVVGADDSANAAYAGGWSTGTNGGANFGPWTLAAEATGDGFAGFFLPTDAEGGNGIDNTGQPDPDTGSAWGSYANKGSGIDRATAFRPFGTPLGGAGDTFGVTFENGYVNGLAGVALKSGATFDTPADFATDARAQFYFGGGDAGYTIADAAGEVELDGLTAGLPLVPFTFFGVDVDYTLTGANTYDIQITKYNSAPGSGGPGPDVFDKSTHAGLGGRTLAGSGPIASLALFNQDVETQSDAYFNRLAYAAAGGSGSDDASDSEYANFGWQSFAGGGSGFGFWEFATETEGGFAGAYLQSGAGAGVDNIGTSGGAPVAPDGAVWASYANKGALADKSSQYRDFDAPLATSGDTFSVSFEHGFIDPEGTIGVSLRDRAVDSFNETADAYSDTARLQFFFEGGDGTYTLVDADGEFDTGIGFSFWGLDLNLTLTGPDTYNLDVTRYGEANDQDPEFYSFTGRTFAGSGSIESLAFFNQDAPTQSDVFFNNLRYTATASTPLPGDYNDDGFVNAADYTVWRDNVGGDNSALSGAGDESGASAGVVDGADYELWAANYGQSASQAIAAVPEPAGIATAAALLACLATPRRTTRHRE